MSWRRALSRISSLFRDRPPAAAPARSGDRAAPDLIAGRYRLERELGRGASGTVHLACDVRMERPVAVKLMAAMPAPGAGRATADDASAREWRAAQRLSHPGIVRLVEMGADHGRRWTVSEYVDGVDLQRYTHPKRLLPEPLVLRIGAQLLTALAYAHARGVVHRDLKPSNVLFELAAGRVRILDFGAARVDDGSATVTGMTLGTPAYMAPEQLAGAPADAASDAYAVGVILFELLAGRRPHEAATLAELLRAVAGGRAARLVDLRPGLDSEVADAVQALLAPDPRARPADLEACAARLSALADRLRGPPPDGV